SSTGANFDIFLSRNPYFMNKSGTGSARQAIAPKTLIAGPTPRLWNMGLATRGNPEASKLRKKVFAETALAA
ncbi:MAG: hypothetical protein Q9205_006563, partial [Flavoplaca limonia]